MPELHGPCSLRGRIGHARVRLLRLVVHAAADRGGLRRQAAGRRRAGCGPGRAGRSRATFRIRPDGRRGRRRGVGAHPGNRRRGRRRQQPGAVSHRRLPFARQLERRGARGHAQLHLLKLRRAAVRRRHHRHRGVPLLRQPGHGSRHLFRRRETRPGHPVQARQAGGRIGPHRLLQGQALPSLGIRLGQPRGARAGRLRAVLALRRARKRQRHLRGEEHQHLARGQGRGHEDRCLPRMARGQFVVHAHPRRRVGEDARRAHGRHRAVRLRRAEAVFRRLPARIFRRTLRPGRRHLLGARPRAHGEHAGRAASAKRHRIRPGRFRKRERRNERR